MIKLFKGNEPQILIDNKSEWTNQLLLLHRENQVIPKPLSTKYNHASIKEALRVECFSKCMYCESRVEHISDLHIEHIKPKAKDKFPELTFEYGNLGLACPVCNRGKSDTFDLEIPFINPYEDVPLEHFIPCGAFVWANSGDQRAILTENEIDLNRKGLIEARGERMKTIRSLIDVYNCQTNDTIKQSFRAQILKEVSDDKIYSFCCKAYAESMI